MKADIVKLELLGVEELRRAVDRLGEGFAAHLQAATIAGALIVQNDAKQRAPYRTGTLRRSIHNEVASASRHRVDVDVGTDLEYAKAIEYGTGPYVIRPKTKKALYWPGAAHPVRKVQHPGLPARPFLRPALDENKPEVQEEIAAALRAVLRTVAK